MFVPVNSNVFLTPTLVFSLVICNKIGLSGLNILKSLQSSIYILAYEVLWQLLSVFSLPATKETALSVAYLTSWAGKL